MARTATGLATSLYSSISLNDGVRIPMFGLGTSKISKNGKSTALSAMKAALSHGYRMLDTAACYENEAEVGQAIKESGVNREDIFVVTKVFHTHHGYESTIQSIKDSLGRLDTGYIDLLLIHLPVAPGILETYDAMFHMKDKGFVRSVGVSNFRVEFLEQLKKAGRPTPSVNQLELHSCCTRNSDPIVEYCNKHGIAVMGWGPMAKGYKFNDPVIQRLVKKYKKSPAQIMIRWSVEKGYITIPKSSSEARVIENANVFDWSLSTEDEEEMDHLPHWSSFEERAVNVFTQHWEG